MSFYSIFALKLLLELFSDFDSRTHKEPKLVIIVKLEDKIHRVNLSVAKGDSLDVPYDVEADLLNVVADYRRVHGFRASVFFDTVECGVLVLVCDFGISHLVEIRFAHHEADLRRPSHLY